MAYKFVNAEQLDSNLTAVADAIRAKGGTSGSLEFPEGMVEAISSISTGAGLNFDIVGNPQPANPSNNTIWVDTDAEITSWIFSAAEPENPTEGMVWIATETASTVSFNALKENSVMVYPLSAKQYAGGAWVDVEAKCYQNAEWVELKSDFLIFDNGNTFDDITGGWEISGVFDEGCLRIYSASNVRAAVAKNKINVTDYKTMFITVKKTGTAGNIKFGLANTLSTTSDGNYIVKKEVQPAAIGTYELDISGMTGDYYITVTGYNTYSDAYISRVGFRR